uniref:Uncharacterized protein n=1 Tax=Rhizophora mucronata TaxID=61149 RepID=A0A2P2QHX2_RHIMU
MKDFYSQLICLLTLALTGKLAYDKVLRTRICVHTLNAGFYSD